MKIVNNLDQEIIQFFAPYLFGSLKYAENKVCLWFPCTGKTRTINNILGSKSTLKTIFGKLASRYVFVYYTGTDSVNLKASEILQQIATKMNINDTTVTTSELKFQIQKKCVESIEQGKEIVFICDSMESLPSNELEKHLLDISNIVRTNEGRIHTILNFQFLEQILPIIDRQPNLFTLTNKIEYIPTIPNKLVSEFILTESLKHSYKVTPSEVERIKKYTGGILSLTRSIIRNGGETTNEFDIKFKTIWKYLPNIYKSVIEKHILKTKIVNQNEQLIERQLKQIGILNLEIFKDKFGLTRSDDKHAIEKILTNTETKLFKYFTKNKNKLISKTNIAGVIYGKNNDEYSDWSIDQTISRFRKKLAKYSDPNQLRTVKGKGYKWL